MPTAFAAADHAEITETHEAIVVGAGPAGLAAAAALQGRGFETLVIESSDAVGGRWRSRYPELRLNSWRCMSNLQGYRMPRTCGRYPSRDDFVAYLERYAAHHRLQLRANTSLTRLDRADLGAWRLETSTHAMLARYVVVATGWDAVGVLPDWPGRDSFDPEIIHASEFRGANPYRGRHVLVVGAGNSGVDIAGHLVAAGASVSLSMRTPPNLASREVLRIPGQPMLVYFGDRLPARAADFTFSIVNRLQFGDLSRFGLPRPRDGPYANFRKRLRSPVIDAGFVAALKRGDARVVADVRRLHRDEVVLTDDSRVKPDAVICATGYRRGLEPLVGHLNVLRPDGVPFAYRGAPEHRSAPRLYFAGMWGQFSGEIRLGPIHGRRIARAAARDRAAYEATALGARRRRTSSRTSAA